MATLSPPITPNNLYHTSAVVTLCAILSNLWKEGLLAPDASWGCRMEPPHVMADRLAIHRVVRTNQPAPHLFTIRVNVESYSCAFVAMETNGAWRALPSLFFCTLGGKIRAAAIEEAFAQAPEARIGTTPATGLPLWALPMDTLAERFDPNARMALERFAAAFAWKEMGARTGTVSLLVHGPDTDHRNRLTFSPHAPGQLSCPSVGSPDQGPGVGPLFVPGLVRTLHQAGVSPHDLLAHPAARKTFVQAQVDLGSLSAHALVQALAEWDRTKHDLMAEA